MGALIFAKDYVLWHYSSAFKEGAVIWKNFIWFVYNLFSIGLLFRTLFSPWRRMKEYYSRGFDPKQYFEILLLNLVMRFIGFFMRLAMIIVGLGAEILVFIAGIAAFIIWFTFPFFVLLCFSRGLTLFF